MTVGDVALYVGAFLGHKNLPRLVSAFATTDFCRDGGRLVLVGGSQAQADELLGQITGAQRSSVSVKPACTQEELDVLFASSLFLVQPSLEEGFGLPVWEAQCRGLPVCASDGGSLPEVVGGYATPFPAASTPAMAAAIDECARRARARTAERAQQIESMRTRAPTVGQFGGQFQAVVDRRLRARGT